MTLVYCDFDQASLDNQYNNQANVENPRRYLDWYGPASAAARATVAHLPDLAYGKLPDERLDIFTPAGHLRADRRPVVAFLHGGAWRALRAEVQQLPGCDVHCTRRALCCDRIFPTAGCGLPRRNGMADAHRDCVACEKTTITAVIPSESI